MTHAPRTVPIGVRNTGFLIDKLGQDCPPLQFLRELTQNSIEAILRTESKTGEIVWDVDWLEYEYGENRAFKLCITDTGVGMSPEEMVEYINHLSSSGVAQSLDGNYGVGAKVACASRNPAGLAYISWQNGRGNRIHFWRDSQTNEYGLLRFRRPDGTYECFAEVEDYIKPDKIVVHGTKVVLFGMSEDSDTMQPPPEAASPSKWVAKYLNGRYFSFPPGIVVKAREGWREPREDTDTNLLRTVTGQAHYLGQHKETSGTVKLTGADAYWWILREEKAMKNNSGFIESSGHVAALYQDELYELASGRQGSARLQQFGIVFGPNRVVIYIEPDTKAGFRLTTNTTRTALLIDSQQLPWTEWAAEFRENMPDEISAMMEAIAAGSQACDHSKAIRDRLKELLDLFKVSRYKPADRGPLTIDVPLRDAGGNPVRNTDGSGGSGGTDAKRSLVGGVYSVFLKQDGQPGTEAHPDPFPHVDWLSVKDGTRTPESMEDRAAKYLSDQNRLLINADFRVFEDMIQYFVEKYQAKFGDVPGLIQRVAEAVHNWYEQILVETVIGVQALRGSREWTHEQLKMSLSEEALTSAVMPRYFTYGAVARELGTQVGSLKSGT